MTNFPTPNDYRQRSNNPNQSYVTINGRRVPIDRGISGSQLAEMAGGRGRRAVKVDKNGVSLIDRSRHYTSTDFMDKNGKPVKIIGIPDRTKGGSMERILVFLDFANVNAGAAQPSGLNYGDLLNYLAEGRFVVEAYAYVPIDPRRPEARRGLVRQLQAAGWMVVQKLGKICGDSYKSNVDVEMCIDIMRSAQQIRPDIIVLCSGDGDFIPVVRELRRMGIRAEVASFENSADVAIRYEASGFISLDLWREMAERVPEESFDQDDAYMDQGELEKEPRYEAGAPYARKLTEDEEALPEAEVRTNAGTGGSFLQELPSFPAQSGSVI